MVQGLANRFLPFSTDSTVSPLTVYRFSFTVPLTVSRNLGIFMYEKGHRLFPITGHNSEIGTCLGTADASCVLIWPV